MLIQRTDKLEVIGGYWRFIKSFSQFEIDIIIHGFGLGAPVPQLIFSKAVVCLVTALFSSFWMSLLRRLFFDFALSPSSSSPNFSLERSYDGEGLLRDGSFRDLLLGVMSIWSLSWWWTSSSSPSTPISMLSKSTTPVTQQAPLAVWCQILNKVWHLYDIINLLSLFHEY